MSATQRTVGTLILAAATLSPSAASALAQVPVVPEPTGLALFAAGAAAVVVGLRLRKNR